MKFINFTLSLIRNIFEPEKRELLDALRDLNKELEREIDTLGEQLRWKTNFGSIPEGKCIELKKKNGHVVLIDTMEGDCFTPFHKWFGDFANQIESWRVIPELPNMDQIEGES